jgi:hypothetical protein
MLGNKFSIYYGLPSSNRWLDQESEQNIRAHVEDACYASSQEVGRVSTTGKIFPQQWLSRIIENDPI